MKKLEFLLVTLALASILYRLLIPSTTGIWIALTFFILTIYFSLFSFVIFNKIRLTEIFTRNAYEKVSTNKIFGAIATGFGLAIANVGIIFTFQSWPGSVVILGFGILVLAIISCISILKYQKTKNPFYKRILFRIALIGGIGSILLLTPIITFNTIIYREHPEYINALKEYKLHPEKKDLKDKLDFERQKMENERRQNRKRKK